MTGKVDTSGWVAPPVEYALAAGIEDATTGLSVAIFADRFARDHVLHVVRVHEELVGVLDEIRNYSGGADSALDDPYVMERVDAALTRAREVKP